MRSVLSSIRMLLAMTLLTGVIYPLLVTVCARALFPAQASGSLLADTTGRIVGSRLIGQSFSDPRYFFSRPSATSPVPYNASASSGSNLGPTNPMLEAVVASRVEALQEAHAERAIPVDLVTTSASGLDPHISLAAATYQIPRVARARGLTEAEVQEIVGRHIEGGLIFGSPGVNVLGVNLDLNARERNARR